MIEWLNRGDNAFWVVFAAYWVQLAVLLAWRSRALRAEGELLSLKEGGGDGQGV